MEVVLIYQIISSVFILASLSIIIIDIIPILNTWISRIHIGKFKNQDLWYEVITKKGTEWLNNTPKVKVKDNQRLIALDMLKGNYTKKSIQDWQKAALLLGSAEYVNCHYNTKIIEEIKKFVEITFDTNGNWRIKPNHVDSAMLAYAIMKSPHINVDLYKSAFDSTWNLIQNHIGEDGTIIYRLSSNKNRLVDTIGLVCPFLICYGVKYNKPECINLAINQIKVYEIHGFLRNAHIPNHAYSINNEVPLGLFGWGRGLGWYALGLIDSWNELPENNKNKTLLRNSIKKFASVAMNFQQGNGSWNWNVAREEARPDSSTTAVLAWYLLNASSIEEISEACLNSVNKAVSYLMQVTRRNGEIDFSQGDTKDIGVYSMSFEVLPFTQGFSIRTYTLLKKMRGVRKFHESVKLSQSTI